MGTVCINHPAEYSAQDAASASTRAPSFGDTSRSSSPFGTAPAASSSSASPFGASGASPFGAAAAASPFAAAASPFAQDQAGMLGGMGGMGGMRGMGGSQKGARREPEGSEDEEIPCLRFRVQGPLRSVLPRLGRPQARPLLQGGALRPSAAPDRRFLRGDFLVSAASCCCRPHLPHRLPRALRCRCQAGQGFVCRVKRQSQRSMAPQGSNLCLSQPRTYAAASTSAPYDEVGLFHVDVSDFWIHSEDKRLGTVLRVS